MYPKALPQSTAQFLTSLSQNPKPVETFYLTGGTALSLHLGIRESEDLDFFSKSLFDPERLQRELANFGILEDVNIDEGTLNCFISGVKLQFLHYPYKLLERPTRWRKINISSVIDIACTKLLTISTRGDKKDFVDVYLLLKRYSLQELFEKMKEKYQGIDYSQTAIFKSLVYFDDAQKQPMPKLHTALTWEEVKTGITEKVKSFKF